MHDIIKPENRLGMFHPKKINEISHAGALDTIFLIYTLIEYSIRFISFFSLFFFIKIKRNFWSNINQLDLGENNQQEWRSTWTKVSESLGHARTAERSENAWDFQVECWRNSEARSLFEMRTHRSLDLPMQKQLQTEKLWLAISQSKY